ncbi:MAG: WYL domain-containing transcriptional regulator [Opitutaceae bacterium]|jgi:predicted DNA-binding transcriptional regulator YafY
MNANTPAVRHVRARRVGSGPAALRRIIFIHERLGNGRRANACTLAAELEVSPRTVKRDIEFMRDTFGAQIVWEPSTQTYFYEKPCDLLPLLRLDADEALALALAGRTFAAWRGSPLGRALAAALGKIAGVVEGAVSLPADTISQLVFQPEDTAEAEAEHRFFAVALEAIRRRRELEISYGKPGASQPETRVVLPLHLAFLDHRWVLIAQDEKRADIRKFVLSRIAAARPTGRHFTPPKFDAHRYLAGSFGLFTGEQEWAVRVWFDAFAAPFIRERRWHVSQEIGAGRDGGIEVQLRLNNLIDVQRWILAWGSHAEALAPAELRETLAREVALLSARYKKPQKFQPGSDIPRPTPGDTLHATHP